MKSLSKPKVISKSYCYECGGVYPYHYEVCQSSLKPTSEGNPSPIPPLPHVPKKKFISKKLFVKYARAFKNDPIPPVDELDKLIYSYNQGNEDNPGKVCAITDTMHKKIRKLFEMQDHDHEILVNTIISTKNREIKDNSTKAKKEIMEWADSKVGKYNNNILYRDELLELLEKK